MSALTVDEIVSRVAAFRHYSKPSCFRHIAALGIEPAGARQRPQLYPADTANRILTHLGIRGVESLPMPQAKAARRDTRAALVTLPKLRRERAAAKRKAT